MKKCPTCPQPIPDDKLTCDECARKFGISNKRKGTFPWQVVFNLITIIVSFTALFVSIWVVYLDKREHHDLIARVLRAKFGDSELYVEVALINRGNQTEIVREVNLYLSEGLDYSRGYSGWQQVINRSIEKGDRQVVRASITNFMAFEGKQKWLHLGVVAINQEAVDVQSSWPILHCNIATNGQGGGYSEHANAHQPVQIVGNKRLPHHKPSSRWP